MVKFFKTSIDPITGDTVTFSERMSLLAQSTVRRWSVTLIHIAFSLFWWARFWNHGFSDPVNMWMAMYSLIAVVNENVIGIGMAGQAKRDAVILRHINSLIGHQEKILEKIAEKENVEV